MTSPFDSSIRGALPPRPRPSRRLLLGVLAIVALGIFIFPGFATFTTDWLWFQEIGFESVFLTSLRWRGLFFLAGGGCAFAFVYGNLRLASPRPTVSSVLFVNWSNGTRVDIGQILPKLLLIGSLGLAFLVGGVFSSLWMTFLMAWHGVTVGVTDALFGRDIGFYLFRLPAVEAVLNSAVALTTLSLVAVTTLYTLRGQLMLPPRRASAEPQAARHVGGLLVLFFVLSAVHVGVIGTADLLSSTTGPLVGASYTDVHVRLPGLYISAITALFAAVLVSYGVMRGRLLRFVLVSVVVYGGVGILARGVVPTAVQRLVVAPNELAREKPYLQSHIAATREAWGLDGVETRDLRGDAQLTMEHIRANAPTIDNVRLWERDLLKQTFGQLQEIRTYYDFVSVDDDRYMIDGKYRQVHVSARELNIASLPTRTFINEKLTFTHGMGIAMAPVNQVTEEGLPVLFIKDLPPVSTISLKLTRPQIYYGELTNSYVFVGTGQKEFDYPAGETNIYTNYTGRGGIPIGSFVRRALYAWQLGSLKILLANDIAGTARILYRRNIAERAAAALPFLEFDADPYLVLTDAGQLKWILDAYTTSAHYPYAYRTEAGVSYLRNSVKVVIDAYDGTVDAYIAEPRDPIIKTYARIFPGIFKSLSAMPADLRRHVRYPGEIFRIQAMLQATYHMIQPETFYHREDQWQIPAVSAKSPNVNPFMRHIILRLPGEQDPEFIYMMPFTPQGKDNLAAWMVARMDGDHYGKLVVYRFPKQSLVYGPKQIANRINQDTEISRQITLWDQRGSEVIRGELLVIPIEESLIYVQPVFLRAEGGTIPELKRVVVAHGNRVVMGETLEQGLAQLFSGDSSAQATAQDSSHTGAVPGQRGQATGGTGALPPSGPAAGLLQQAQQHYDRAMAAQRAGNWAEYGREIERLGTVLKELHVRKP